MLQIVQYQLHLLGIQIHILEKITHFVVFKHIFPLLGKLEQFPQALLELCLKFFVINGFYIFFFFLCHFDTSSQVIYYFVLNQRKYADVVTAAVYSCPAQAS